MAAVSVSASLCDKRVKKNNPKNPSNRELTQTEEDYFRRYLARHKGRRRNRNISGQRSKHADTRTGPSKDLRETGPGGDEGEKSITAFLSSRNTTFQESSNPPPLRQETSNAALLVPRGMQGVLHRGSETSSSQANGPTRKSRLFELRWCVETFPIPHPQHSHTSINGPAGSCDPADYGHAPTSETMGQRPC